MSPPRATVSSSALFRAPRRDTHRRRPPPGGRRPRHLPDPHAPTLPAPRLRGARVRRAARPRPAAHARSHGRGQHCGRGERAGAGQPDPVQLRTRHRPAHQLPRHPARRHRALPHRAVRRRDGGTAERGRQAGAGHQGQGAAAARGMVGARLRADRGRHRARPGEARHRPPPRPRRARALPGRHRLALQEAGLLRRRREGADAGTAERRGAGGVRRERGAPGRGEPGGGGGEPGVSRREGGQADGHPARGILVVPQGRIRRAEGRGRRPRPAPALVRRPGVHRFPGHRRLAGAGQRARQGDAPSERRRRGAVRGRQLRHPGKPPLLDRRAPHFCSRSSRARPFSRSEWDAATEQLSNLYANNGYIYARIEPVETRRTACRRQVHTRPRLADPRGISRHPEQDRDRRQRRHPRAGDPRGDRAAARATCSTASS